MGLFLLDMEIRKPKISGTIYAYICNLFKLFGKRDKLQTYRQPCCNRVVEQHGMTQLPSTPWDSWWTMLVAAHQPVQLEGGAETQGELTWPAGLVPKGNHRLPTIFKKVRAVSFRDGTRNGIYILAWNM